MVSSDLMNNGLGAQRLRDIEIIDRGLDITFDVFADLQEWLAESGALEQLIELRTRHGCPTEVELLDCREAQLVRACSPAERPTTTRAHRN
jgi:hypothetical protein